MLEVKGPFCQSCGMPMVKDPGHGGTEADGSKSAIYCSHCYQKGVFTEPNLTVDQMEEKVLGIMAGMHIPRFIGRRFTREMPSLQRWKST